MAGFDKELKHTVWLRDGERCVRCSHRVQDWDVHHRLARKMGGANARVEWINWVSNLLLLCRGCHNWIEANPVFSRSAGWMLSAHQNPEDVLVWSEGEGMWFRLHGPEFYKDPVAGLLAPFAGDAPPTWAALAA